MPETLGWQRYLFAYAESSWGVLPGAPDYFYVPMTDVTLAMAEEQTEHDPYTGDRQRRYSENTRGMVTGQLSMHFSGIKPAAISVSIAQFFIERALSAPAGTELDSFGLELYDGGVDNKRWSGCRINTMTIAGNEADGITLTFDIIAKEETGGITVQANPADKSKLRKAIFQNCTFQLAAGAVKPDDFSIAVANNLVPKYQGQTRLQLLGSGPRNVDYDITLTKSANTYDVIRRSEGMNEQTAQLILKALQDDGNTFTQLQIDFARFSIIGVNETAPKTEFVTQALSGPVLKPDSATHELATTWSDV